MSPALPPTPEPSPSRHVAPSHPRALSRHRRAVVWGSAALTVVALGAAAGGALLPAAAAGDALTNGGFEAGLAGWSCSAAASAGTGQAHGGSASLVGVTTTSDHAQCTQSVAVSPGTTYTLSAFVDGAYVFLGASGTGGADPSTWTPSTSGYRQLATTFTTGAATRSVTVYVHGWYAQGTYRADDITLTGPDGTATTTQPTGATTSATTTATTTAPATTTAEPTHTPTATTTAPSTGSGLPRHALTGYWQNFVNGATPLRLRDVPAAYDLVAVAFADADPARRGGVTFTVDPGLSSALGGYTAADVKADVAALHARGTKVVISVGGQNGTVTVGDAAAAANFAASVESLIRTYGFDGVDIDLENGVDPATMSSALHALSSQVGPGLVVTMAPETIFMQSSGSTYLSLALKIKDILTVVHTQYYNSGSMLGCDGKVYSQGTVDFITAQACIAIEAGLRPDQVAVGLPASPSGAGSGYVAPSVVNAALDCLATGTHCGSFRPSRTYPDVRGAMTWSVNWDRSAGNAFSTPVAAHLDTLP